MTYYEKLKTVLITQRSLLMTLSIRQIAPESKLCHELSLDLITDILPRDRLFEILQQENALEERERKLNMCATVYILIAMSLFAEQSMTSILHSLSYGLRRVWPEEPPSVPRTSALCYRRQQLGSVPLLALMEAICQPLATPETPGAFRFGYRLMAVDSTIEAVPATAVNDAAFGRLKGRKGESAFPQVRGTYLLECGTHAIINALFMPCRPSERHSAKCLLTRLTPEMLLLWDTGFHEYDMFRLTTKRYHAQALGRVPAGPCPQKIRRLADGSWLVHLFPTDRKRKQRGEFLELRLIEYTLTDPALPGYQQTHRLLTSLLDPELAPALELVCVYHERWEIELAIDELDTHQRLLRRTVRSKTPDGVIQELFATVLGYDAVRALMVRSAQQANLDPDRLSFVHAICLLRTATPIAQVLDPSSLPEQMEHLLTSMREVQVPQRHLRINARVVKRKYSPFNLKRPEHLHPPRIDQNKTFRDLVLLI
jgi:hypothetical protein